MGGGGRRITAAASNGSGRGEGIRAVLVRNGAAGSAQRLPELRRTTPAPAPASSATSTDAGEGGEGGSVGGGELRAPPGGGANTSHGGGGDDGFSAACGLV
jgi:hypothetical protein